MPSHARDDLQSPERDPREGHSGNTTRLRGTNPSASCDQADARGVGGTHAVAISGGLGHGGYQLRDSECGVGDFTALEMAAADCYAC